ncbi:DUF3052 family protein [Pacificimonas sp. WHA3]|uniref:DUF3052 family protein n=2 Tax=Pacificimonas pallii TaxID=2827236 RepID=A0ABS6SC41_9SPHN|nr:DUF3052 family protein [Pacificimonas pallii]
MVSAGYSGTQLGKKLGVKHGALTWRSDMPDSVADEIDSWEAKPILLERPRARLDHAHIFVTARQTLADHLERLRPVLADNGMVWVSWPKKASKVPSEVTGDTVRDIALPMGFVDVKVCAVDAVWSGLKPVIRKELRGQHPAISDVMIPPIDIS